MDVSGEMDQIESEDQQRRLLKLARETAVFVLRGGEIEPVRPAVAARCGGAFVTLWNGTRLRGCVGQFAETSNIAETIATVTRQSLADSRFQENPVTLSELDEIRFELSILSGLEETSQPLSLVPGTHGVVVRQGGKSGCFLPKVAEERRWNAEEFLANCCTMKAGLPSDAWRDESASVSLFTVQVIAE